MLENQKKKKYYVYAYLDPRLKGEFVYGKLKFEFEPFYIGKGKENRYFDHLNRVLKKLRPADGNNHKHYRIKNIVDSGNLPIIVFIDKELYEPDAFLLENNYVKTIGRRDLGLGPLTNLTDGGNGRFELSEESRKKLSESLKGKEPWNKGKQGIYSEETKNKISKTLTGRKNGPLSEKQKQQISKIHKGKIVSEQTRQKQSESQKKKCEKYPPWNKEKKGLQQAWNKGLKGQLFGKNLNKSLLNKKGICCVLGASGFIGSHMVTKLKKDGYWVRGVDIKDYEFNNNNCDEFIIGDLCDPLFTDRVLKGPNKKSFDMIFQFACLMGGAQFIFTGENDADIMHDSVLINANIANYASKWGCGKLFFSSSACVYNQYIQENPDNKGLKESDAYPVDPDSNYGYEKIFSERLYQAYRQNKNLNVYIGRFHNIFGEYTTYKGGKEKAPAAICRKVAEAKNGDPIEIFGDGKQTRTFLGVNHCIEAVMRLLYSDYHEPINIGSDELISINDLAKLIIDISGKDLSIKHIDGPQGVRGRSSDNSLIKKVLNWAPCQSLRFEIENLYNWINTQINS